jgi:hypothetical protein
VVTNRSIGFNFHDNYYENEQTKTNLQQNIDLSSISIEKKRKVAFHRCLDRNSQFLADMASSGISEKKFIGFSFSRQLQLMVSSIRRFAENESLATHEVQLIKKLAIKIEKCNEIEKFIVNKPYPSAEDLYLDFLREADSEGGALIPGGCQGNHAMLYQIKRTGDEEYTFTILNTGRGVKRHHYHVGDEKTQTSLTWSCLTSMQIANTQFLQDLITFRKNGQDSKRIYSYLQQSFGKVPDPVSSNQQLHHKTQLTGTCTQQIIQAFLHSEMPNVLYHRLKVGLTREMIDAVNHDVNKTELDIRLLTYLEKTLTKRQKKCDALMKDQQKSWTDHAWQAGRYSLNLLKEPDVGLNLFQLIFV